MDDPAAVRVREPVEDLRRRLHRLPVAQLAAAHRLAQRAAADVLVRDVDVTGVGAEPVRAQAALVPEPGGRLGLAFGAVRGLALPGNDLQRDVEPVPLVPREPDRAGTAAAKRAERAVAVEDELPAWERMSSSGHDFSRVGRRRSESCRRTARSRPRHSLQCPRSNRSFAMSSRDTDFEFDFFEEPETQEAPGRSDRSLRRPLRGGRGPRMPTRPDSSARRLHAAAAAARPDRLRDPDRRPAPALGAELPGGQEARRLQQLHDEHEGGRRRLPARGPRAQRRAHDPGDQARRAAEAAREPRPAAGARDRARAQARSARAAARVARSRARGARLPRQRPRRPLRGVPAHAGVEGRGRGRGAARLAGRAARRERRRLGRPLQGTGDRAC